MKTTSPYLNPPSDQKMAEQFDQLEALEERMKQLEDKYPMDLFIEGAIESTKLAKEVQE